MDNNYITMNKRIFAIASDFLNNHECFVTEKMIKEITEIGFSVKDAYKILVASFYDIDYLDDSNDKILYQEYFEKIFAEQINSEYEKDLYYQNIKFYNKKIGNCEIKYDSYKPYEAFVYNDIERYINGKQIPKIGFFRKEFKYPAIYENNRLWMSVTPNEINTMKEPIKKAFGKVLMYGLGIGYFAYMVSLKDDVEKIIIIEKNKKIIDLFYEEIYPQFENKEKIEIICEDAFIYADKKMGKENFDFVFCDLWHDVSDGLPMYLKMKEYESRNPKSIYMYWIEKSIKCYL